MHVAGNEAPDGRVLPCTPNLQLMAVSRTLLTAFALPLAFCGQAQYITLDVASTVPAVGTSVLMHRGNHVPVAAGGIDQGYDFSSITETSSSTYNWTLPSISPNASLFPTATLALNNGGPDTIFYQVSAAGMERVGETRTIDILLTNFPVGFDSPVLELPLPLTYGDTWTDVISGSFDVDGTTGNRTGTISGTADATSFVTIPGVASPIHALRTTTTVFETINFSISGFPVAATHKRTEVAFRSLFSKLPVFRTVSDSITSSFGINQISNFSEWMDATTVGVPEQHAALGFSLAPNPASDRTEVILDGKLQPSLDLRVLDARGTVMIHQAMQAGTDRFRSTVNVADWPAGLYQVVITGADGRTVVRSLAVGR
jgi:hypothetical protein